MFSASLIIIGHKGSSEKLGMQKLLGGMITAQSLCVTPSQMAWLRNSVCLHSPLQVAPAARSLPHWPSSTLFPSVSPAT